jgi:hypothetical protein
MMNKLYYNRAGQFGSLCPPGTFETCTGGWKSDRRSGGVICKGWVCKTGRDSSKPWRNEWQSVRADIRRALYGPGVRSSGAPMGGVGSGAPGAPSFLPDVNGAMEPAMPEPMDIPALPPEPIEYGSAEFPLPWPEGCLPDPNACVENGIGVIPFDCEVDFITGRLRCFGESSQFSGARFFLKPYFAYTPDGGTSLKYVVPEVDFGGRKWLYVEIPDLNLTGWAPLFEYGPDDKVSISDI